MVPQSCSLDLTRRRVVVRGPGRGWRRGWLVVADTLAQAVPKDLQPAVAQRAHRGVVAFTAGSLDVVELPRMAKVLPPGSLNHATLPSSSEWIPRVSVWSWGSSYRSKVTPLALSSSTTSCSWDGLELDAAEAFFGVETGVEPGFADTPDCCVQQAEVHAADEVPVLSCELVERTVL